MWNESWLKQFPKVHFETGEHIINIDEPFKYNYYLISGLCARIAYSPDGESLIMHYYSTGKMLGLHLNRYGQNSISDFVAKSPCLCYKIPCTETQKMLLSNNQLCYDILQESLDEYDQLATASFASIFGGGLSVLCHFLKQLAEKQNDGSYIVPLIYSNTELSQLCGVHAVSISRMLNQLKHNNIIARCDDGIHIKDMKKLESYIKIDE